MKKGVLLILTVLILLVGAFPTAAQNNVTYSGNAGKFIFEPGSTHSPTDLFENFKDVMPGDSLKQTVVVKNHADNDVKVKIYLRSRGAHEESAAFLSQLRLRVALSDDNPMPYMFDAAADQTAQLTDWVCLGTLYSGGAVKLDVLLDVPVELDNRFSNQIGFLDWEFKVEEFPVEDGDPKPPQTGEDPVWGWGIPLFVLIATAAVLFLLRRKPRT